MTRTTSGLAPSSPNFRYTLPGRRLTHNVNRNLNQAHISGGSSDKSGFEPRSLRGPALTTRPPWLNVNINKSKLNRPCITCAGHFEIHLNNRHLPLPFMLTVLQAPGILTPSIDGLLPFITELSSTDCTIGNIPKQVAYVLTSVFP
ncbi:hypothetical protein AVEN_205397-1 [Araneus ventricosus]|uniref:Uncharacterized protein n=1 Tax=Araneus ventricosus TaxID=182803 RepID=A0A4Y2J6Z5_ARAVE|nr:hypothetical protein AVEN_205397-1 [Araneus ventricosus]